MKDSREVRIRYQGKGYTISYKVETIDLSMTPIGFLNVFSVFINDPELQEMIGDHFTILHNHLQLVKPVYDIISSGNMDEVNLKKEIAQQIMNNPTE